MSDPELVIHPVVGLRCFDVNNKFQLTGPIVGSYTFTAGENVAGCDRSTSYDHIPEGPHQPGTLAHSCGFYAYTNGTNTHYHGPSYGAFDAGHRIPGIIEGYGHVTVGAEGFRAEKCRVVALVVPDYVPPAKTNNSFSGMLATLRLTGADNAWMSPVLGVIGGWAIVMSLVLAVTTLWCIVPLVFGLVLGLAGFVMFEPSSTVKVQSRVRKLSKRYPNAQIYGTVQEAVEKHPLRTVSYRGKRAYGSRFADKEFNV